MHKLCCLLWRIILLAAMGQAKSRSNSSIATVVAELKQLVVGLREEMKAYICLP